jgi:hypothetical protein
MEYLAGSLSTILTIALVLFVVKKIRDYKKQTVKIIYSQSNIYERIKPAIPFMPPTPKESQSRNHRNKQMVRIIMISNKVYWISENRLFEAPITEDGFVDYSLGTPIDTIHMDKVELDKISFIVDKLTEGNSDDRSNTGN